ncbi:MAG: autotransporter assembly complex family protein [Rhodoferax sp.]|uniref:autotransporter assembly complex protein TamA n=1 Tax=Rhodoferax sp. TaxID=50421 RepID=UPI003C70E456|nr:autotransporter assembly complex protein TamA [Rhodoferax sp.]
MNRFLLAALLLLAVPWAVAAEAPPTEAGRTPAGAAFEVKIQAPDDIKDLLTRHLELQRYRELTDLSDDELARLLRQAEEDARRLVGTLGYFSPVIVMAHQPAEGGPPVVTITVTPGEATRITQVTIEFTGAIAADPLTAGQREQIQANWSLPAGNRFTQNAWDAAKQQALRQLTSLRFPTGRISASLADIDPEIGQAHLHITLDSGPLYRLGELEMAGLQRYDRALVQNLARITPGSTYSQAELVAAQQRLTDSGYFDSAFVTLDTQADPAAAPVQLKLREARLQKLVLGIGASTDNGPRLSAEHTHYQVPGIGWRAVSKLQLQRDDRSIGSELTSPPDPSNWRWAVSGLLQNQLLGTRDVTSQQLRGGRKQSHERTDRNLYVQYDRAESVDTDAAQPVTAQSLSANYAFAVRNYDSLPFPSSGWGWGAELGGGTTLGSERQAYTRLLTRWQGFLRFDRSDGTRAGAGRLALRAAAGAVIAKDSASRLPSTQLFLAGGDNSVRGYGFNDIGVTLADGSTTAGRYLSTGSVEWQRPIRINGRLSNWESTVFVDAGAVANKPAELDARVGVGVGARWNSPVGPLQIDLAYGVDARRFRLHMNLGFTF